MANDLQTALRTIAEYPVTDLSNLDAVNMRHIAQAALTSPVAPEQVVAAMEGVSTSEVMRTLRTKLDEYSRSQITWGRLHEWLEDYVRTLATPPAATPAAPSAGVTISREAYDEATASMVRARDVLRTVFGMGRKVGPIYSHANGAAWGISSALALLERSALAQPAPVQVGAQQAVALSDDEIDRLQEEYDCFGQCDAPRIHDFARGVEKAVLDLAAPTQAGAGDAKGGA